MGREQIGEWQTEDIQIGATHTGKTLVGKTNVEEA